MIYNMVVKNITQQLVCRMQVTKTASVFQENFLIRFKLKLNSNEQNIKAANI